MTWSDFILRGTLLLAAAFLSSYAFARASAALRHLIWTAAFVALLLLPGALGLSPKIAFAVWPAATGSAGTAAVIGDVAPGTAAPAEVPAPAAAPLPDPSDLPRRRPPGHRPLRRWSPAHRATGARRPPR